MILLSSPLDIFRFCAAEIDRLLFLPEHLDSFIHLLSSHHSTDKLQFVHNPFPSVELHEADVFRFWLLVSFLFGRDCISKMVSLFAPGAWI